MKNKNTSNKLIIYLNSLSRISQHKKYKIKTTKVKLNCWNSVHKYFLKTLELKIYKILMLSTKVLT